MSALDGSHLRLQPPVVNHGPQILRPAYNRHFPLLPSAFESRLYVHLQGRSPPSDPEKPKIPLPESPLKPLMKTEDHTAESVQGTTGQGCKEEIRTYVPPIVSVVGGKTQKTRKSKHKRLMPQAHGSVDGGPDVLASNSCRMTAL